MFNSTWERVLGPGNTSSRLQRRLCSKSIDLVQRMELQRTLEGHDGCVNAVAFDPTGTLLVSGSDDQRIMVWDWEAGSSVLSWHSGHNNNVFQARFMPHTNNTVLVSCAADGQVRCADVPPGAGSRDVTSRKLAQHDGRAHRLALDPLSPRCCLYSCGEDGEVMHFDLRLPHSRCRQRLLVCHANPSLATEVIDLNCIHVNPISPHLFAVGGGDEWVRVYDRRRTSAAACGGAGTGRTARVFGMNDEPVVKLAPARLMPRGPRRRVFTKHVTGIQFSGTGELLATYNDDDIFLFAPESYGTGGACSGNGGGRQMAEAVGQVAGAGISGCEPPAAAARQGAGVGTHAAASGGEAGRRRGSGERGAGRSGDGAPGSGGDGEAGIKGRVGVASQSGLRRRRRSGVTSSGEEPPQSVRRTQHSPGPHSSPGGDAALGDGGGRRASSGGGGRGGASGASGGGRGRGDAAAMEDGFIGPRLRDGGEQQQQQQQQGKETEEELDAALLHLLDEGEEEDEEEVEEEEEEEEEEGEEEELEGVEEHSRQHQRRQESEGASKRDEQQQEEEHVQDWVIGVFSGHRNSRTVKGVSFLGADDEYVVSGSDDGHVYIWSKATGSLLWWAHGDEDVVNCLEPHPFLPMTLATSGIDDTIKLWAPTAPERSPVPPEAHRVMERNREARARGPERAVLPVSPEILRLLFGRRRGAGSDDERGHEGGEDSDGEEGCRVS